MMLATESERLFLRQQKRDDQLLYLMLKPPAPVTRAIDRLRLKYDLSRAYTAERFHITLVPFGDVRIISPAVLECIRQTLAPLQAEPFEVTLSRIDGNALVGQRTHGIRDFQRMLIARLTAAGLTLPDYDFSPHLSLCYTEWQQRNISVEPIRWRVEQLLLINSQHGRGHRLLDSWQLVQRQGSFPF